MATALASLRAAVVDLAEYVHASEATSKDASEPAIATARLRKVEDDLDEEKQKNLKGKFMITSLPAGNKECIIKSDDVLLVEKKSLVQHILELANQKYEVKIPESDISSCIRLYKGGVILSIWNQRSGSAYEKLCKAIKTKNNVDKNIFFNFMLTKRRSSLLYEVRQLKKDEKIKKFFSDENGSISIKIGEIKEKIASKVNKETGEVSTITLEELRSKFPSK